ncbi:MAG: ABC transporter substrate-binding protein, partial [Bradyrhizobium sp.]|nr:ABC transporter substrate-binding protein [Bradyrhizobium sp.]
DAVQVEAEELELGCSDGIYEKIDWQKIGGKDGFIPAGVSDCGVGAIVWSTGLAYDGDKIKDAPKSWADFWDTAKYPGKRGLRKGAKYTLEFALMADGVPATDVYKVLKTKEGVDRAFKKLDALKADIIWWEAGAQPLQLLSSGQVAMTSVYNGRISNINRTEGKHFGFVFPNSIYAVDSWVVLKGSPNKDAAMNFIAFASQAENQAKLPEYIAYGLPNIAAARLVPEKFAAELPTTPDNLKQAIALDVGFWTDNSEELSKRFNAWLAR